MSNIPKYESSRLTDALAGRQAAKPPPFGIIAGFVGLYLFLLIPVSYFILKKIDKREFTWITAPILIIGFTGGSYALANTIKGGLLTLHRAVVYEGVANSDQFAGYAQMTLYSPKRTGYDISFPTQSGEDAKSFMTIPTEISNWFGQNQSVTMNQDKIPTIKDLRMRLWDKRSFEMLFAGNLGGGIGAKLKVSKDKKSFVVTITNETEYTLKDCALIIGNQNFADIGTLKPEESKTLDAQPFGVHSFQTRLTPLSINLPNFSSNSTME